MVLVFIRLLYILVRILITEEGVEVSGQVRQLTGLQVHALALLIQCLLGHLEILEHFPTVLGVID